MNFIMSNFSNILEFFTAVLGFLQIFHAKRNDSVVRDNIKNSNLNTNSFNGNYNDVSMNISQTILSMDSNEKNDKKWLDNVNQHIAFLKAAFLIILIISFLPLFYQSGNLSFGNVTWMRFESFFSKSLILFVRCVGIFSIILLFNYLIFRKPWTQKNSQEIFAYRLFRMIAILLWTIVPILITWLGFSGWLNDISSFVLAFYVVSLYFYFQMFYTISILGGYYFFKKVTVWPHILAWAPTLLLVALKIFEI